jgi:hypothetical protein
MRFERPGRAASDDAATQISRSSPHSLEPDLHDFITKSIKLHLVDPHDPSKKTTVLLSLAHIVRMVPQYYLENDGKRMITEVADDEDAMQRQRGIKRSFIIYDDISGRYESYSASRKAQTLLEQIWAESA